MGSDQQQEAVFLAKMMTVELARQGGKTYLGSFLTTRIVSEIMHGQGVHRPNFPQGACLELKIYWSYSCWCFVAAGDSFWYTITSGITTQFSLCRWLGFFSEVDCYAFLIAAGLAGYAEKCGQRSKQIKIYKSEWVSFLGNKKCGLSFDNAEHTSKRFDAGTLIKGKAQLDGNR